MELRLVDGLYVPAKYVGLERVSGTEELLQRIVMKLRARRGSFLPLPDFGSRLYTLSTVKPSQRASAAKQFVQEALAEEAGLNLEALEIIYGDEDAITIAAEFSLDEGSRLSVNTRI